MCPRSKRVSLLFRNTRARWQRKKKKKEKKRKRGQKTKRKSDNFPAEFEHQPECLLIERKISKTPDEFEYGSIPWSFPLSRGGYPPSLFSNRFVVCPFGDLEIWGGEGRKIYFIMCTPGRTFDRAWASHSDPLFQRNKPTVSKPLRIQ